MVYHIQIKRTKQNKQKNPQKTKQLLCLICKQIMSLKFHMNFDNMLVMDSIVYEVILQLKK